MSDTISAHNMHPRIAQFPHRTTDEFSVLVRITYRSISLSRRVIRVLVFIHYLAYSDIFLFTHLIFFIGSKISKGNNMYYIYKKCEIQNVVINADYEVEYMCKLLLNL